MVSSFVALEDEGESAQLKPIAVMQPHALGERTVYPAGGRRVDVGVRHSSASLNHAVLGFEAG